MTRDELNYMLDRWEIDPDGFATCDLLCEVADALGLPNAEYSVGYLRAKIASSDLD